MLDLESQSRNSTFIGDMRSDEFLAYGAWAIEWIANYLNGDGARPLLPRVAPGSIVAAFPPQAPSFPVAREDLLETFERLVVKNSTHWNDPKFVGYFGLGSSKISIVAEMLECALDQTRMLYSTSAIGTELEQVVADWIRQLLGLPPTMFGMFHSNSRVDLMIIAALEARGFDISRTGLAGLPTFRVYASEHAHGSVEKAMAMTGLGKANLCKIAVDTAFRMDPEALRSAIEADIAAGHLPLAVVATVGTTSTTSIDPVRQIADICEQFGGLWLHIDAAYAGPFAFDRDEMAWILDGCERADSFTTNLHKAVFMPFNYSLLYIKWPELLKTALGLDSPYLHHGIIAGGLNRGDYSDKIPHRNPAFVAYMTLSYFGVEGIVSRHREHRRLAHLVESLIEASPDFELMAPVHLPVVCFRAHPQGMESEEAINALNVSLMHGVNDGGGYFLSDTSLNDGKFTLRIAIGNIGTQEHHVLGVWEALHAELSALLRKDRKDHMTQ